MGNKLETPRETLRMTLVIGDNVEIKYLGSFLEKIMCCAIGLSDERSNTSAKRDGVAPTDECGQKNNTAVLDCNRRRNFSAIRKT